jgi:hypothetical protein
MQRKVWMGVLLAVPVIALALAARRDAAFGPAPAQALDRYLESQARLAGVQWRVAGLARAEWPRRLEQADRTRTLGDSARYLVDAAFEGSAPIEPQPWDTTAPGAERAAGRIPVPYPAQQVWCAWLEPVADGGPARQQLIFVALHQDLYNAAWLVHQASPAGWQHLDRLACTPAATDSD